jgi:hypothetical protein
MVLEHRQQAETQTRMKEIDEKNTTCSKKGRAVMHHKIHIIKINHKHKVKRRSYSPDDTR